MRENLHAPTLLAVGERVLGTHCIEGLVGPRAALDDVQKRKFLKIREV
jgi:hypothetical protein